jgi:hypothetical protein
MVDRDYPGALASEGHSERGSHRPSWAVLALPLLVVTGILVVAWISGSENTCGGPVPGCASLRNAGDIPVTVRTATGQSDTGKEEDKERVEEVSVAGGERVLLSGWGDVRVSPEQCLVVEAGPLWDVLTVIDRTTDATGIWHPVDDWGARVQLHDGECPGEN